jgi:drug/metabolite transporter (DMT)-like permease
MKVLGVALLVFGIAALVFGGFGYNRQSTVLDVGGIKATATEHKTIPVAPIAGVVAVIGGLAVLVAPQFRRA